MATNTKMLKAVMVLNGDNIRRFCKDTGKQESNMGMKVRDKKEFRQSDIALFIDRYNLTPEQVMEIWFPESHKGSVAG